MKIHLKPQGGKSISRRKLQRLMEKIYVRPVNQPPVSRNINYTPDCLQLAASVERMDPKDYINARQYLARMQMAQYIEN